MLKFKLSWPLYKKHRSRIYNMQNENIPVMGIAYSDDNKFNFYIDDHSVTFMCTDQSNIQLHGPFVFGHTFEIGRAHV